MAVETKYPLIAKAIRIVLVFSLVFWCSLGVEWAVAFGDDTPQPAEGGTQQTVEDQQPQPSQQPPQQFADEAKQAADAAAAQQVIDAIASLPDPEYVTAEDKPYIDWVVEAFYALTSDQRGYVSTELFMKMTHAQQAADAAAAAAAANPDPQEDEFGDTWGDDRFVSGKHDQGSLVDIEAWSFKTDSEGQRTANERIRSITGTMMNNDYTVPQVTVGGDSRVQIFAVPKWVGDAGLSDAWKPKVLESNFLKWEVIGNDGYANVNAGRGVITVEALAEGTFTIACVVDDGKDKRGEQVSADYTGLIDSSFPPREYPDASFAVMLEVRVVAPPPYVSIDLLQSDGTTCAGIPWLNLTDEQLRSYEFQANVIVHENLTGDTLDEFLVTSKNGLQKQTAEQYGNRFSDLTWQVFDESREPVPSSVATIKDGVFKLNGSVKKDGPFIVRVSSPNGLNGETSSEVQIGERVADPQGESHPQNSLHITSNAKVESPTDSEPSGEGAPSEGAGEGPSAGAGDGAAAEGGNGGDAAENGGANAGPNDGQASPIDKTYTVDQLETLAKQLGGSGARTYAMRDASDRVTIKGAGLSLAGLLADAGITDIQQVNAIEFVNYRGDRVQLDRSMLGNDATIALRSRVLTGDEAEQGKPASSDSASSTAAVPAEASGSAASASSSSADVSGETEELLDNTRFRLLFDNETPLASLESLCWINEINVMVNSGEGGHGESGLSVRVDYSPVSYGGTAILSAIPSQEIGGSRFGLTWQWAKTETAAENDWTDVSENGALQTLRVLTDEEHVGRWYRVKLTTDMTNPETGEPVEVVSPAVELTAADDTFFSVTLAYDPPLAGDTAIFQAAVEAAVDKAPITIDPSKIEYFWELSEDGGASWTVIDFASGQTFAVKTQAMEETSPSKEQGGSDGDGGEGDNSGGDASNSEPVVLKYIRVRAVTTDTRIPEDKRVAISQAQPFTVRVGGAGEDPDGSDKSGEQSEIPTEGRAEQLPVDDRTVTPISNIVVDNTPRPATNPSTTGSTAETPQNPQPQQTPATSQPQNTPIDELVINPEISAMIIDQQTQIDRAATSSKPGARWTQLSTVEPTNEDIRNILADNPFAPFAIPLGLAFAVAGGLEKFLAFRRQKR